MRITSDLLFSNDSRILNPKKRNFRKRKTIFVVVPMMNPFDFFAKYCKTVAHSIEYENTSQLVDRVELAPIDSFKIASIAVNENAIWLLVQENRVDVDAFVEFDLFGVQVDEMNYVGHENRVDG